MDYYAVLQINRNCTKDEIKKAFYKLAHIHHPDKGGDEKEFKKINEAYQYLMKHHQVVQQHNNGGIIINQNGFTVTYYYTSF